MIYALKALLEFPDLRCICANPARHTT